MFTNGKMKYSLEEFDGYEVRVMIDVKTNDGDHRDNQYHRDREWRRLGDRLRSAGCGNSSRVCHDCATVYDVGCCTLALRRVDVR